MTLKCQLTFDLISFPLNIPLLLVRLGSKGRKYSFGVGETRIKSELVNHT